MNFTVKEDIDQWNDLCDMLAASMKSEMSQQQSYVQIIAMGSDVEVRYENSHLRFTKSIPAIIASEGEVFCPAKAFACISRTNKDSINIELQENTVQIKTGRSRNQIQICNGGEILPVSSGDLMNVSFKEMHVAIKKLRHILKKKDSRGVADKINFIENDGSIIGFTTDGHRMSWLTFESSLPIDSEGVAFYAESLPIIETLMKISERRKADQMISTKESSAILYGGGFNLRVSTVPAFKMSPLTLLKNAEAMKGKSRCRIESGPFMDVLKKLKDSMSLRKTAKSDSDDYIRFLAFLEEDRLVVASNGGGVKIIDEIPCFDIENKVTDNGAQIICASIKYFQDAVQQIEAPEIVMEWIGCEESIQKMPSTMIFSEDPSQVKSFIVMSRIGHGELNNVRPENISERFKESLELQRLSKPDKRNAISV